MNKANKLPIETGHSRTWEDFPILERLLINQPTLNILHRDGTKAYLSDAIVFRFPVTGFLALADEVAQSNLKSNARTLYYNHPGGYIQMFERELYPYLRLPYDNMFFTFGDAGYWVFQNKQNEMFVAGYNTPAINANYFPCRFSAKGIEQQQVDPYFQQAIDEGKRGVVLTIYPEMAMMRITSFYGTTIGNFAWREDTTKERKLLCEFLMADLLIPLRAILTINCTNVRTVEHPATIGENKRRASRGLAPLVRFHTLKVMRSGKGSTGKGADLWQNAEHLCRGHFKTYTDAAPLFGRYTGMWWWEPQSRGSKQKGKVVKDYDCSEMKS